MAEPDRRARAASFGAVAEAYEHGRPGYPAEAIRACIPPGAARVLDLAAGTGKLTRGIAALGYDVVAVEPDAELRRFIPGALAGTAEAIPLADASVDAVLVGQAFHWFDQDAARAEMRRVLRPGGRVGLLWNLLDDRVDWVHRYADVIDMEDRASRFGEAPMLGDQRHVEVPFEQPLDADGLVANALSRSAISLLEPAARDAVLARVRAVAPAGAFGLRYVCHAYIGRA